MDNYKPEPDKAKNINSKRRNYRAEIPYMVIDDPELSGYEKMLYVLIVRRAGGGKGGKCTMSGENMAKALGWSSGLISKVKSSLKKKNYIRIKTHDDQGNPIRPHQIFVIDKWDENYLRYSRPSLSEGDPSPDKDRPSLSEDDTLPGEGDPSWGETKNKQLRINSEEEIEEIQYDIFEIPESLEDAHPAIQAVYQLIGYELDPSVNGLKDKNIALLARQAFGDSPDIYHLSNLFSDYKSGDFVDFLKSLI